MIGERPSVTRQKEIERKKLKESKKEKDALRKIALDKGLNPNF